jgi:serine protein kinase
MYDRDALNAEMEKIEKPSGVANPKDFRNECVNFCLRQRATNSGKNPDWRSYEKIREVIEKKMFASTEELLPIVSFSAKGTKEEQGKHDAFIDRMTSRGYTRKQVELLVSWYSRYRKHN